MSSSKVIMNASAIKVANHLDKLAKKGRLTKLVESNIKKSSKLVEILKGSNNLINFSTAVYNNDCHNISTQPVVSDPAGAKKISDAEYLKSYYTASVGGPKNSIAVNRAHHLTKYLSDFIINAYQSGLVERPSLSKRVDQKPGLLDYTFEISSVELVPDLTSLKVYWYTSGVEEVDVEIEHVLETKTKTELRNLLANGRVLSYIPPVKFLRDQSKAMMNRINSCIDAIKHERQGANAGAKEQAEELKAEPVQPAKKKETPTVSNLYGVDFNRLIESIKKTNFSEYNQYAAEKRAPVASTELISESATAKDVALAKQKMDEKFRRDMFSFQLNQKKKYERLSKSAIMKISLLEYEEFKQQKS